MEENQELEQELAMEDVLKNYDFKKIHTGEIIKGSVLKVTNDEVIVNINYFSDGIINKDELSFESDVNPFDVVKEGDEISVKIISTDDGEGNVVLSKKQADEASIWDSVDDAKKEGKTVVVKVKSETKGGLIASYKGLRVFIPGSQAAARRIELNTLVGQELEVKLTECDKVKKNIVASRRVIEEAEIEAKKNELWSGLTVGEKREGKVTRLAKFGAFVDIGGVEGLVHVSDLSWKRVNNPEEVVSVGDTVNVFIQSVDREKNRLSLALKDVATNPWTLVESKMKTGDVVEGKVLKFTTFGAFVEVADGVEGLVHLSEISDENIAKPSEVLEIGQTVKVKVLSIDAANHKMSLSIKDAVEKSKEYLQYTDNEEESTLGDLLKDKLSGVKFE
ncbi:30S ribosomal protein S1 [Inconstantimicrobium mannanitabidum]|uniref:30S ribosomal protein S1 n=1 Tax=Inconstantimicrobium mannanitabidum TaxID=1604901 RepID=A0ACB5R7D3_9CLOT|nr:30S ribosomal protein S1 [Clostridium sp. TW13]GKX65099.1 30S ribosomal protein S1 [Clostridium sp. TW13]